jgi:hypothetical protein
MNDQLCNHCDGRIQDGMDVKWNSGEYHAGCIGEAVLQNRANKEQEIPAFVQEAQESSEISLNDFSDDFEGEDFDQLEEGETLEELEGAQPIIPEIVVDSQPFAVPAGTMIAAPRALIFQPTNGSTNGTIINGAKGSKYVEFPELRNLPIPETTSTFKPVPFYDLVTKVMDGLHDRRMRIVDERFIISQDGMKLFGLLELEQEYDGVRFAVGLRSSNDKSMKLALACGYKVICCSNGMLSGDFMPLAVKHSVNLDIDDALALGIDRIRRRFGNVSSEIANKKARELSDGQAEHIVYQAFTAGKFPISMFRTVHKEYFVEPSYKEFEPRNLFSLENAFTSAFKKLQPMQQFEATSRLAKFLLEHKN